MSDPLELDDENLLSPDTETAPPSTTADAEPQAGLLNGTILHLTFMAYICVLLVTEHQQVLCIPNH